MNLEAMYNDLKQLKKEIIMNANTLKNTYTHTY